MSSPKVLIATTRGPVEVVSITKEEPEIRSVLCLNESFQELPISSLYESFVRRPTGIIEHITGHASYRTDLSGPITQGSSWQLGLTIAHLFEANEAIEKQTGSGKIIFSTGSVSPNGKVGPARELSEKWKSFVDYLAGNGSVKNQLIIAVHPDNVDELRVLANSSGFFDRCTFLPISQVDQIISYFGFKLNFVKKRASNSHRKLSLRFFILAILIFVISLFGFNEIRRLTKPLHVLDNEGRHKELKLELSLMRKNGNFIQTNSAFFFEKYLAYRSRSITEKLQIKLQLVADPKRAECSSNRYATITTSSLPEWSRLNCPFRIHLKNQSNFNLGVWLFISNKKQINKQLRTHAELARGEKIGLAKFELENENENLSSTFSILISPKTDDDVLTWYNKLLENNALLEKMAARIRKSGFGLVIAGNSSNNSKKIAD